MKLYCGIDLHSNNSVVVILDEKDKVNYQKKLDNNLALILQQLSIYKSKISAIIFGVKSLSSGSSLYLRGQVFDF